MRRQAGFFDVDERLKELSAKGDVLERLAGVVNFELFRPDLARAVPRSDGTKGGRPPFDHVFMWKVLILQASHSLSDERTEFLIKDRLSFMRFLGIGLADAVPDANTIWTFREALTRATLDGQPAIQVLFRAYEAALKAAGFLAMGGQIIDASIIAAPKQRNTEGEKAEIRAGRIPEGWADKPAKLAQKDRDARWTVKWSKAKPAADGSPRVDLAVPAFGYKNHIGIDRRHGLIRTPAFAGASSGRPRTRPGTMGRNSRPSSPGRTPEAASGPTRPIGRRQTSGIWPNAASSHASIARSRRGGPCRRTSPARTVASQRSAARWSTSSPARKARWPSLCEQSASPGRA